MTDTHGGPCYWAGCNDVLACRTCGIEYAHLSEARPRCGLIARIEAAEAARSEAIRLMSESSREAGEWKGRYKAAGHPDTLDGLIDRAEKAEARARALEEALTPSG